MIMETSSFIIPFDTSNWIILISSLGTMYGFYLMSLSTERLNSGSRSQIYGLLLMIFTLCYVGTRPLWCYTDSKLYSAIFNHVQSGVWDSLQNSESEWFFAAVEYICIDFTDAHGWFFVVAAFYILGMCFAAWRWLPRHFTMAVMFMFTAFSFWAYSNNGLRQGMGASLILAGLACMTPGVRKNWFKAVLPFSIMVLGCACHNSLWLTVVASIAAIFIKSEKIVFYIWCACLIVSPVSPGAFIGFAEFFISDHRLQAYGAMTTDEFSRSGWRWDFILYSCVPVVLGYYAVFKKGVRDWTYIFLFKVYMYTNAMWMLVNAIAYSNRFAYISWSIYPLLLCYPLAKFPLFKNQGAVAGIFLIGCIVFNLLF